MNLFGRSSRRNTDAALTPDEDDWMLFTLKPRWWIGPLATACLATPVCAQRTVTKLADGIYEIQWQGVHASGNTTVIVGDRQVFVVDAGFLPSEAKDDIAQVRQWTDKPVTFLLNTHFHNDHNLANRTWMDAFPALTVVAHVETKKDMDLFGPGSLSREERSAAKYEQMLTTGKTPDGTALSNDDKTQVKAYLVREHADIEQIRTITFQSATLTFDHDFTIDLGHREVQIKFLGRGNTNGDAIVYLPREKIVIAGDLVVSPFPYFYDGYPTEWIQTMNRLAELDATTIVPGHGAILHDKAFLYLIRDIMQSAVSQMTESLRKTGPAMFKTLDDVKGDVDLTPYRQRFAGNDKDLGDRFDAMATDLVRLVFREAALR